MTKETPQSQRAREMLDRFDQTLSIQLSAYLTEKLLDYFERSILSEHSDGVVTCPICGDDNSPCKVCNGHGFLTTEEAAGWLLAQRDVSEHDSRVKELEALLGECLEILQAAARPGERPSLLVRIEAALNGGSDAE